MRKEKKMQKKKEKFLNKIVKKNYNNELEMILEKKSFDETAKNLLLNMLYKMEASYKDYEKVKRHVETKEEYIKQFINMIQENCDHINICKMNSKESEVLGDKTFLVDKENKRIICYPIERKLLYCIAQISKQEEIIKKEYPIIHKTMSNMINIGNTINTIEPLRDFNGYSWTTIFGEIESIPYNLIYQNLRILLGYDFLNRWIQNKEFIIDYFELFKNKLEETYGSKNQKEMIKTIEKLSVLLQIKYHPKEKEAYEKEKKEVENTINKMENRETFIEMITNQKRDLAENIKLIDETINHKERLQMEYVRRNENLPLKKKIFSVRILSKLMLQEREEKLQELETLNGLLNPKKFIAYKREMEERYTYLKLVDVQDLEKEIEETMITFQKIFLRCYKIIVNQIENKTEMMNSIYEFRYNSLLPFNEQTHIYEVESIKKEMKEIRKLILEKAQTLKVMLTVSKNIDIDEEILRNIFHIRAISLEEIYIKLTKEKEKLYIHLFDEDAFEEKIEMTDLKNLNKKDLEIKLNKKIKVFN